MEPSSSERSEYPKTALGRCAYSATFASAAAGLFWMSTLRGAHTGFLAAMAGVSAIASFGSGLSALYTLAHKTADGAAAWRAAWRVIGRLTWWTVEIGLVLLMVWGALSAYEAMSIKTLVGLGVLLLAVLVFRGRR